MADPFDVTQFVRREYLRRAALIEEYCERSLTDPEGRGVLIEHAPGYMDFQISLSTDVPWGTIREIEP